MFVFKTYFKKKHAFVLRMICFYSAFIDFIGIIIILGYSVTKIFRLTV